MPGLAEAQKSPLRGDALRDTGLGCELARPASGDVARAPLHRWNLARGCMSWFLQMEPNGNVKGVLLTALPTVQHFEVPQMGPNGREGKGFLVASR